jgi:hypothetical protein
MSGLYNVLFGQNDQTAFLLGLLGLSEEDFGRFRDVYVTEDHIVVHTRCGGGNRDDYGYVFDEISSHPLYQYDEDDSYDCTYADFYFKYPEGYEEVLKELAEGTITPSEKWEMMLKQLDSLKMV